MFEEVERQAEVNAEKNTKEAAKAAKRERNLVRVARIEEAAKQNPEEKARTPSYKSRAAPFDSTPSKFPSTGPKGFSSLYF